MFKRSWRFVMLSVVVLGAGAAGAAFSAPEGKREVNATEVAKGKVAREVYQQLIARYRNVEGYDIDDLAFWSERVLDAESAAAVNAAERTAACEAHLARTTEIERIAASHYRTGQAPQTDALAAEYYRLDAETKLAEAKRP